ncbi:MAG: hypothetical protein QXP98_05770 [Thermoproteus sp.]
MPIRGGPFHRKYARPLAAAATLKAPSPPAIVAHTAKLSITRPSGWASRGLTMIGPDPA